MSSYIYVVLNGSYESWYLHPDPYVDIGLYEWLEGVLCIL